MSMLHGVIIKESLEDLGVLEGLGVVRTEVEHLEKHAPDQPSRWNLVYFEIPEAEAKQWAEKFGKALKRGTWYVDFKNEKEIFVVFAGKHFRYQIGDAAARAEAQAHGRSIGIPEKQLNWSE